MWRRNKNEDKKLILKRAVMEDFIRRGPGYAVAERLIMDKLGQKVSCQFYN